MKLNAEYGCEISLKMFQCLKIKF